MNKLFTIIIIYLFIYIFACLFIYLSVAAVEKSLTLFSVQNVGWAGLAAGTNFSRVALSHRKIQ